MAPASQRLPHVCMCVEWIGQMTESDLRVKTQAFGSLLHCWCCLESPGKGAEALLSRSLSQGFWGEEKPWAGQSCYLFRAWGLPGLVGLVGKSSPSRSYPSVTYLGTWQNTHCFVSPTQGSCMGSFPTDTVPSHKDFYEKLLEGSLKYIFIWWYIYIILLIWHRSLCSQASLKLT